MFTISQFKQEYFTKIDVLDLELLISAAIKKSREFVLTHPEYKINKAQSSPCLPAGRKLKSQILRRINCEPLAYILGQKEFYGLEFKVDKNTLIPRPETEQLADLVIKELQIRNSKQKTIIADIGTGSGNIIISIAKTIENLKSHLAYRQAGISNLKFIGIDISTKALTIAKQNAKKHKLNKKISFLHGNLLEPIVNTKSYKLKAKNYIIIANLPYLSSKIYSQASPVIKNYEPKSALLSNDNGLGHYKKLFQQLKKLQTTRLASTRLDSRSKRASGLRELRRANHQLQIFIEFSPEQKTQLKKVILTAFPKCYMTFFKDLAGKFRVAQIKL